MPLTPEEQERVREIARITGEEVSRVVRPDIALGQEATRGAGLKLRSRTFDLSADGTFDVFAEPARCLAVVSGGEATVTLRVIGYDGQIADFPAAGGLLLGDVAIARLQLVVPDTGLTGDLVLMWSEVPHALGSVCCESDAAAASSDDPWELFEIEDSGAGNTDVDVEPPEGFHWDLISLEIKLVNDATAAARTLLLEIFSEDGTTAVLELRNPDAQSASQTSVWMLGAGGGAGIAAQTNGNNAWTFTPLRWTGSHGPTQSNIVAFRISVENGVAGDAVTVTSRWWRKVNAA